MSRTKLIPKSVDKLTVIDLQNIDIGETEAFRLPSFESVKSAQSTACYYGKTKKFGKKWTTKSRESDNLLIIKALPL